MPNQIDANGLQVATREELVAQYTAAFQTIYGADINLDPDTPDGQMIGIFIQTVLDLEDLLLQNYTMFDPDNAIGLILDQRVAINGIQRRAGTFSTTNIVVVTSTSVNLYGLDQSANQIYTVADNAGNQWELITTQLGLIAGTATLAFRAKNPGAVLTVPNTITVPVTIIIGVTSVNNPTAASTTGVNEETDAALRIRRQRSVALSSQGYLNGLLAALGNIPGVTSAFVYENVTGSTDGDGIPGHSIWVIVAGSGANADIASAIYRKRNAGCGMKGTVTYDVPQVQGVPFTVKWDVVTTEDLYIKFTATSLDGVTPVNYAAILAGLPLSFVPGVNDEVNVNDLATAVRVIDPNCLVTSAGFSTTSGGSYTNTLSPSSKDKQFVVDAARIIILPILATPSSDAVGTTDTIDFEAIGGYGTYTWTINTNVSGGSINSATGEYTAGATPGTDVVRVTDGQAHFTNVNVVVS